MIGVDSVIAPPTRRQSAWPMLPLDLNPAQLAEMTTAEPISQVTQLAEEILAGRVQGWAVIDLTL